MVIEHKVVFEVVIIIKYKLNFLERSGSLLFVSYESHVAHKKLLLNLCKDVLEIQLGFFHI